MNYPEKGTIGIYKITSPTGRIYIGQSICIKRRWRDHKKISKLIKTPLYKSFIRYGYNNHIFEIIEECNKDDLNTRERYWQEYYNSLIPNGLNCVLTDTNESIKIVSDETKNKIRISCTGRYVSEETKKKMSESNKGKKLSIKHKEKLSISVLNYFKNNEAHNKGKKFSIYTREKMSLAKKGKQISEDKKKLLRSFAVHLDNQYGSDNKMAVLCLNIETGIFYDTISDAADSIPIKFQTLYAMLSGRNKNKTSIIKF